jgi:RND family efflux transporter MFP subunit
MNGLKRSAGLAGTFLALTLAVVGCTRPSPPGGGQKSKGDAPLLKVTVAKPFVKTVTEFTDVTGSMKAVKRVEIRPQVSGYIKKVWFKDGAEVKEGEVLVSIDPSLYRADLDKAKGELASAEASAKLAGLEEASASQEEFDQATAKKAVSQANVLTAKANVERAQQNLDWCEVKAPFAGLVDRILINEGNLVSGGTMAPTVLTVLITADPIYAYFDLDEETVLYYRGLINAGKFKSVQEEKLPIEFRLKNEKEYPNKGQLDFASKEINPLTGTLSLRATIPNPAIKPGVYKFAPGMFVRARIPGAVVEDAVLVPDSAIVVYQDYKVIYTIDAQNKAVRNKVVPGPLTEGLRVIASGIRPTDRVVINGLQSVQDGVLVEPVPGEIVPVKDVAENKMPQQTDMPVKPQVPAATPAKK